MSPRTSALGLVLGAAVLVAAALPARSAYAQGTSSSALAEALFDEGKKLLDGGQIDPACAKFEASQKLDPGLGTLLFLGECYERAGKYASAWGRFREAASLAAAQRDSREAVAKSRADALEPKLFKLTVTVPHPTPGLAVMLDGEPIAPATWGVPLPTDGGAHTLEARAQGFIAWKKTIELPKTTGQDSVEVPALEPAPEPTPQQTPLPKETPPAPKPSTDEGPGHGLLIGGIIVGGLGVAALGVTGALVGVASSKYGDADAFCSGTICSDQQGVELSDEARTLGDAATGTFVAGLALAGAGLTMILLQPSSEPDKRAALTIAPGPGDLGAALRGSF
jgi:hypothetical protein